MNFTISIVVHGSYLMNVDDKWFKSKQKAVGITAKEIAAAIGRDASAMSRIYSGAQPMTLEQASIIAEMIGADLSEVCDKAGILPQGGDHSRPMGFGESDVELWQGKASQKQKINTIATAFGARPGVDVWRISSPALQNIGYFPNDFILVDTIMDGGAQPNDIVIAQIYDWRRGRAETVLRQYVPPVLIDDSGPAADRKAHVVDNNNVVIKGRVLASWRT